MKKATKKKRERENPPVRRRLSSSRVGWRGWRWILEIEIEESHHLQSLFQSWIRRSAVRLPNVRVEGDLATSRFLVLLCNFIGWK